MNKTKNDCAWELLFATHNIAQKVRGDGRFEVSSAEINKFREARLMTKFDHSAQLPEIFVKNNFTILPVSRGGYVIGNFATYCDFNSRKSKMSYIEFPSYLESIDYKSITSEATAINCAFVCKMLHEFTSEASLIPTVSGRMGSSSFAFVINSGKGEQRLQVKNSQIEIDGGYEGENSLILIEAKNYISEDFLVRQLYYPYRLWSEKISKNVRSMFLTYSNGLFHLREYGFSDSNNYSSIFLKKDKKFAIYEGVFNIEVVEKILDLSQVVPDPSGVPFPQANSFERVVSLCELLYQRGFISKEGITLEYGFNVRQTYYYANAGRYLGLIKNCRDSLTKEIGCVLTEVGKRIFALNLIERQKEFLKLMVSHSVFNKVLRGSLENGEILSKPKIAEIMKSSRIYGVSSDDTYLRRASTVLGWINWVMVQLDE